MMNTFKIAAWYSIFAVIATLVNIGTQEISITFYDGDFHIAVAMLLGTATGLVTKYKLDKVYIFKYQTLNAAHDGATFALYTAAGILTTGIFWSTEALFHMVFDDKTMRYAGGAIGLAVGYAIKYQLDKHFVFTGRNHE